MAKVVLTDLQIQSGNSDYEEVHSKDSQIIEEEDIKQFYFINNICNLKIKSAENVTRLIKYRFSKNQIYTWAGQTLIAVQPYDVNSKNQDERENEPSVNSVVARALFKLSNKLGKINQIIVISGDSGSGKTYSGCMALKYLAYQYSYYEDDNMSNILRKTCSAVTVLAAFGEDRRPHKHLNTANILPPSGNASTSHNSNSSRFGKLTQIQCRDGKFVGAYFRTFLLEKSRVSGPNRGESNFHIFSQVLHDLDEYVLEKVYLSKTTEYAICPRMVYQRKNSFSDVVEMMNFLNIKEINDVLQIISVILNLGNIVFTCKDENISILQERKQYVNFCAWIFQCSTSSLTQLFTKRLIAPKLRRGSMCYTSCANIEECNERKNSFMRFLYEKLFNWLVDKSNEQTYYRKKHECLGILDIYGFETFSYNTFEQLCINYANERLQQFYMNDYFNKQVNYLYEKCEKIAKYDMSKYNKRISLLDGTLSIFGILNEECLVKRYNTDMFIATRLSNCLRKNEFFIDRKHYKCTKFSIRHYAGVVEYDSRSMVSKNRDKLPEEMILFLKETKLTFLSTILDLKDDEVQISHSKTLLSKFKKSLDNLMISLNQADTHYIKCLKPNQKQLPNYFDDSFFINELKYNGIMDTLNLEFQSFSTVKTISNIARQNYSLDSTLDEITVIENVNYKHDSIIENNEEVERVPRIFFKGDRIISRLKIAQVPVRFHIRKTCIPYSHILPLEEMPRGLIDIF